MLVEGVWRDVACWCRVGQVRVGLKRCRLRAEGLHWTPAGICGRFTVCRLARESGQTDPSVVRESCREARPWRDAQWWRSMQALSEHVAAGEEWRHPVQTWARTPDAQLAAFFGPDWAHRAGVPDKRLGRGGVIALASVEASTGSMPLRGRRSLRPRGTHTGQLAG